jgi:hypothetical protein
MGLRLVLQGGRKRRVRSGIGMRKGNWRTRVQAPGMTARRRLTMVRCRAGAAAGCSLKGTSKDLERPDASREARMTIVRPDNLPPAGRRATNSGYWSPSRKSRYGDGANEVSDRGATGTSRSREKYGRARGLRPKGRHSVPMTPKKRFFEVPVSRTPVARGHRRSAWCGVAWAGRGRSAACDHVQPLH